MQKVLIIGATSAIAEAVARLYAKEGARLYLFARNQERLATLSQDLQVRGAEYVGTSHFDANDVDTHPVLIDAAIAAMQGIDIVLIAHGTLPEQQVCEKDVTTTLHEFNTNAVSTIALLTNLANILEAQQSGTIAVISSVSGDRGRQSNYVYGAAKGAITIFLQGLRNRLSKNNVHVLTIKPGFVDTPMTRQFKKGVLWVKPERIASDIVNAIRRKQLVIYTPRIWRLIMLIIRLIPERIFIKLNL